MRSFRQIILIAVILQIIPVFAIAESKSDKVTFQLGLKTRIEWWILRREVASDSRYSSQHIIVDTFRPQAHLMNQPELIVGYKRFCLSVSASISSETSLKQKYQEYSEDPPTVSNTGTGRWNAAGAEIGYGGRASVYLGVKYRRIDIIKWPNDSLFSHTVIAPVVGMRLHGTQFFNHENIVTDMNMFIGFSIIASIIERVKAFQFVGLSQIADAYGRDEAARRSAVTGGSLDMGWRPNGGHLNFTLGYGVEMFIKYIGKSPTDSRYWQEMASFTHGASFTISWGL